jgi:enamine deaminase RidA (YjgF/YER057c/UK114 family)
MATTPPPAHTPNQDKLKAFESTLPTPAQPIGSYVPVVQVGNVLFTSGALPVKDGKLEHTGAVGSYSVSLEKGREAARLCAINCLGNLRAYLGGLDRIKRIIKLTGFVNSAPVFYEQPAVINGASDLLVELFGEQGRHARSAVGVSALPMNASVELEMIVEVH